MIKALALRGIEACYVVPTQTGLEKSIMDAHVGVRDYLRVKGIHDFDSQDKGPANKRVVEAQFVTPSGREPTRLSLYRPETKGGDPRLWISNLGRIARPENVVGIVAGTTHIFVINLSDPRVLAADYTVHPELEAALRDAQTNNPRAPELLAKLRAISAEGYIDCLRPGPTGIGFTLETRLGILANSSKEPDYHGIEIKSARVASNGRGNRITLFSRVPDWANSPCKSGAEILKHYGYLKGDRLQLYCSLNNTPNSLGHFMSVKGEDDKLFAMNRQHDGADIEVVRWDMDVLRAALSTKHKETFWVKARTKKIGTKESFHFTEVKHTRAPLTLNLGEMIDSGRVELDYALHMKTPTRSRDHGYLFKIYPNDLVALFPPAITYDLR